ncbi:MAG: diguanylate cyclase, partial [Luteimonas sp.]
MPTPAADRDATPAPGFEAALLAATTPAALRDLLATLAAGPVELMTWRHWPDDAQSAHDAALDLTSLDRAIDAVEAARSGATGQADARVLYDDGPCVAVMLGDALDALPDARVQAVSRRLAELLTVQRMRGSLAHLAHAEQLQHALFAIADMAGAVRDMDTLLSGLHTIIGGLMYAENFYIALLDEDRQSVRFIYFSDEFNGTTYAPDEQVPIRALEGGLTWYVLRDCVPLMGSLDRIREQVSGPLRARGADATDWLGVPMLRDGRAVGAMVVQSYRSDGERYSTSDRAVLGFVAEHVLNAVERTRQRELLERHVAERTHQLAEANAVLQEQVQERLRAEHLQSTLYRIAALATTDEDSIRFYEQVHRCVGELINADNFYIALLDDTGTQLHFPYSVDDRNTGRAPRPLGRGLSEYVIRTGKAAVVDLPAFERLVAEGELERVQAIGGAQSVSWLGGPLIVNDEAIGLVAVQSYRTDVLYGADDAELLNFVSSQIASSLQRRNAAETLRRLNADLEARVQARTRELIEQIAVREQIEAQLKHQVMHDPLTGLPNRLYLRDRLERALASLRRRSGRTFALLYLDVDRFKLFNDSLGHLAGDDILKEVAQRLLTCVRPKDVVARLSGDEFAILLEESSLPQTACRVAERILRAFAEPMRVADRELLGSTSIGIAIADARYTHIDALLHDADVALYRAKTAGRARYVLFDESLQRAAMDVLGLELELRAALTAQQFEPVFQPLVRLGSSEVMGYEALLRWRHPERGLLAPGEFLTVAEDSGLIEAIDWQLYRKACTAAVDFVGEGQFITLNISPRHFQSEYFDERLVALTREVGLDPTRLRIEVTEGTLLVNPEAAARSLARLRAARIETALDDFGTGYSSLS